MCEANCNPGAKLPAEFSLDAADFSEREKINLGRYKEKDEKFSKFYRKHANELLKNHNISDSTFHMAIINLYSKSLALAPFKSEEHALSLSNRSLALMHVYYFKEAIEDVNDALLITNSDALKIKLLCTKIECLIHLNSRRDKIKECVDKVKNIIDKVDDKLKNMYESILKKAESTPLALKFAPEKVELFIEPKNFISDAISWKYNEKFGNHLIATKDLGVGEHLFIENFYCAFPIPSKLYITCSYCLNLTVRSIPCEHCPFVVYCSIDCKDKAWDKFHEYECALFPSMFAGFNQDSLRLFLFTARLLVTVIKEKGVQGLINESRSLQRKIVNSKTVFSNQMVKRPVKNFDFIYGLTPKLPDILGDRYVINGILGDLQKTKFFVDDKIFSENLEELQEIAHKLHAVILTDIGGVDDHYLNISYAEALYPVFSLLNHKCEANVRSIAIYDSRLLVWCEKPIKKGEQLFGALTLPNMNKEERQFVIKQKYNFVCDCIVCEENWPPLQQKLPGETMLLRILYPNIFKFYQSINKFSEKPFSEWKKNLSSIKKIKEKVEKGFSTLTEHEATKSCYEYFLYLLYLNNCIYNRAFFKPNKCLIKF